MPRYMVAATTQTHQLLPLLLCLTLQERPQRSWRKRSAHAALVDHTTQHIFSAAQQNTPSNCASSRVKPRSKAICAFQSSKSQRSRNCVRRLRSSKSSQNTCSACTFVARSSGVSSSCYREVSERRPRCAVSLTKKTVRAGMSSASSYQGLVSRVSTASHIHTHAHGYNAHLSNSPRNGM